MCLKDSLVLGDTNISVGTNFNKGVVVFKMFPGPRILVVSVPDNRGF